MAECSLRAANGRPGVPCDEDRCTYWRAVEHLDLGVRETPGCAIQFFNLLEGGDGARAAWLLSVKERLEREQALGKPQGCG